MQILFINDQKNSTPLIAYLIINLFSSVYSLISCALFFFLFFFEMKDCTCNVDSRKCLSTMKQQLLTQMKRDSLQINSKRCNTPVKN